VLAPVLECDPRAPRPGPSRWRTRAPLVAQPSPRPGRRCGPRFHGRVLRRARSRHQVAEPGPGCHSQADRLRPGTCSTRRGSPRSHYQAPAPMPPGSA